MNAFVDDELALRILEYVDEQMTKGVVGELITVPLFPGYTPGELQAHLELCIKPGFLELAEINSGPVFSFFGISRVGRRELEYLREIVERD